MWAKPCDCKDENKHRVLTTTNHLVHAAEKASRIGSHLRHLCLERQAIQQLKQHTTATTRTITEPNVSGNSTIKDVLMTAEGYNVGARTNSTQLLTLIEGSITSHRAVRLGSFEDEMSGRRPVEVRRRRLDQSGTNQSCDLDVRTSK
jgi:hypothetical protein